MSRPIIQICFVLALVSTVVFFVLPLTVSVIEDALLLQPAPEPLSSEFQNWKQHKLKSGGMILVKPRSTNKHNEGNTKNQRIETIFICHGNAGSVNDILSLASPSDHNDYNFIFLEYNGFGSLCDKNKPKVTPTQLYENLKDAWSLLTTDTKVLTVKQPVLNMKGKKPDGASSIVYPSDFDFFDPLSTCLIGFSIGGGVVGQFLKSCLAKDMPGEVVLLNSFYKLSDVVDDQIAHSPLFFLGSTISSRMKTKWDTEKGLRRYMNVKPNASIFMVSTEDDTLIYPSHTSKMMESLSLIKGSKHRLSRLVLPNGGHNSSIFFYQKQWMNKIGLPPSE